MHQILVFRGRLALLNMFKPSSDLFTDHSKEVLLLRVLLIFMFHVCLYASRLCLSPPVICLLTVPRLLWNFLCFLCLVFLVHCCLVFTCWDRTDLLALVCDVYCIFVTFPRGILGQVLYWIVSFLDRCRLSYFIIVYFLFLAALSSPAGKSQKSRLSCVCCFIVCLSRSHMMFRVRGGT